MKRLLTSLFSILILITPPISFASDTKMNNDRLDELISRIDNKPGGQKGYWRIQYKNIPVYIITSEKANRMRIISPITASEKLPKDALYRMMQANFDSALDARYSIAKGKLWSAFIHPLHELTDEQFISGLAQTITLVNSYGSDYSSGALVFSGGDSQDLNNKSFMEILKKGLKI